MKKFFILTMLSLSTVSALAHGYMAGRLEDAVAKTDQAVLAKITAIKETPIYHKLKNGGQGPQLTTQRDYTLEVIRVLAGSDRKPDVATYTDPIFVVYDDDGKEIMGEWIMTSGSGKESSLTQGQEYVLCLSTRWGDKPPNIIRAESVDRADAVTTAMQRSQCWKVLKTAFTAEEFKSIRLAAYDATNSTLVVMIPSPPRPELGSHDSPRARIYTATPDGTVTRAHEFNTNLNFNHLYFDGKTVVLRANDEYTMVFPYDGLDVWKPNAESRTTK